MSHWKNRMRQQASMVLRMAVIAVLVLDAGTSLSAHNTDVKNQGSARQTAPSTDHTLLDPGTARLSVSEAYGRVPLSFEANLGQTDPQVKYLARGSGYTLFLTATEAVLRLRRPNRLHLALERKLRIDESPLSAVHSPSLTTTDTTAVVRTKLVGSNPHPHVLGLKELPGKVNYLIGNDPSKWRTNVPTYGTVRYEEVYRGVDMVYYGNQGQLEYDFIVAPGADPKAIVLDFDGAEKLELDARGDLIVHTAGAPLRLRKPTVYQEVRGSRQEIAATYTLSRNDRVGFQVDSYDHSQPLVIDPVLLYSTYLGGSLGDIGNGINVDLSSNAYITGSTVSLDFPTEHGFQAMAGGGRDVFVARISPLGGDLVYSTYLGGSGDDDATGVGVDAFGNAVVVGVTSSTNFPTVNALQALPGGQTDAFVATLRPGGATLIYSTYLGGLGDDGAADVIADSGGGAYITGVTRSVNFPTTVGAFDRTCGTDALCNGGVFDAFVAKLNARGSALIYSTFLGGARADVARGITADSSGNAYVIGVTESTDFPTKGAVQPVLGGGADAFVTKLGSRGGGLVYSTYLGGGGADSGAGIAVDNVGNATVIGTTASTNFPTAAPLQPANAGGEDAFVAKLNGSGAVLIYSTYLGGGNDDRGSDVGVDFGGVAHIVGTTRSPNFPTRNPIQATYGGGDSDAFVARLAPRGGRILFSTFLGGSGEDIGARVAVDVSAVTFVTGTTLSTNFPTKNPLRPASGLADAFASKIGEPPPTSTPTGSSK